MALCALIMGGNLIGCKDKNTMIATDTPGFSYYVWENETGYPVVLSLETPESYMVGFENKMLSPGESHMVIEEGFVSPPTPGYDWVMTVSFGDLDEIRFSGGGRTTLVPEGYDHDFNPTLERNYTPEEVESPEGCKQCPGVRWTYTFTDEAYAAAVEYLAQVEAEEN